MNLRGRTPLFISYTGLLGLVESGKVTETDLANALFHFGAARDHVFNPNTVELQCTGDTPEEVSRIHGLVCNALTLAEAQGRVNYRVVGERGNFDAINELLVRNGHKTVDFDGVEHNYTSTMSAINKDSDTVEAIWN